MKVTLADIQAARKIIEDVVKNTELDLSKSASSELGCETWLKFENEQIAGSFKIRGALNKMRSLTDEQKKVGVIANSAGNHAQGVAHSAHLTGVQSTIVMPEDAPLVKVAATKGYGANVVMKGETFDEAKEHCLKLQAEHGYTYIHPFEDEKIISGQGTIALEILEKLDELDSVVVPIGGGGLISGIATVVKELSPKTKIIGVQSDQAPGMHELFHNDQVKYRKGKVRTIADGIAIKAPSQLMHDTFISKLVDDVVTVNDIELAQAIVFLLERAKTLAEGSGAAAMAAALAGKVELGQKTCLIVSGGNADLNIISKVIDRGLQSQYRLSQFSVIVADVPGMLSAITEIIAELGANVLEVHHSRTRPGVYLRETEISFLVETNGPDHYAEIKTRIEQKGVKVRD